MSMPEPASAAGAPVINMGTAIRDGLLEAARRDPSVIFFGEGVEDPGALFGTLKDIGKHIGHDRMIEMPIAENGLIGVAIGAALAGKRSVVTLQRVEFALLALEQILNNAAKMHYVSRGNHKVPLVLRMIVGRGWGQGPEHSQSLEAIFAHVPGLKVIMPAFAEDAKGMVTAAVEDDNPVVVIEHRWSHYTTSAVAEGYVHRPLDGPRTVRQGDGLTIVATSYMTLEAVRAADGLAEAGYPVEVLDLRVVRPLNLDPIVESVARTGRLLTVDTGFRMFGIGAEIASEVTSRCFDLLEAAPVRMGLPDHPTPSSRGLVRGFYPDAARIARTAGEMMGLEEATISQVEEKILADRGDVPIDVPDPFFKGPF
ncbi:alpha-ketoacid dehydrogenase subunit beta [Nisaea sediminum]|uniref:alpha-ketoacid dehydrogenase subunit beta n=1 Tax=Nisaea sediminum TaxID=2775867 RepID=UPI0018683172|nr:transketolase C-terminal domain-containing protein [Nisaea sediminum]